jgi:mono/diheme cytochrome c family protein
MMKPARFLALTVLLVLLVAVLGAVHFVLRYPNAGAAPGIKVDLTPERVKRGEYLAINVLGCIDCHSVRDWRYYAGPIVPGTEGKGGDEFGPAMGLPGRFYGSNITPAAIGDWSDGELFRAIVSGVNKGGEALLPIMPYPAYNRMPEEDIHAVIAYVRTLKPIENRVPSRQIDFPVNFLVRTMPVPYGSRTAPADSDEAAYGEYVTALASCSHCHTPTEKGKPVEGMAFAGGSEFVLPNGRVVRASNISSDPGTGIGHWSRDAFLARFQIAATAAAGHDPLPEDSVNTIMPWIPAAGMSEKDLGAIYAYLRTVKPVKNQVEVFPDARKISGDH